MVSSVTIVSEKLLISYLQSKINFNSSKDHFRVQDTEDKQGANLNETRYYMIR